MLSTLYPISFFISFCGLAAWFYFQKNPVRSRLMSKIFIGGFFVYLFSLAFAQADFSYKLLILFRDLVILGVTTQILGFVRRKKALFFALLGAFILTYNFFFLNVMQNTFPQQDMSPPVIETMPESGSFHGEVVVPDRIPSAIKVTLDKKAELLIEVKENTQIRAIQSVLDEYNLTAIRAFYPEETDFTDLDDYYTVDIPAEWDHDIDAIKEALLATGALDWAEENEQVQLDPVESEGVINRRSKYSVNDPEVSHLWSFEAMQVEKLYRTLKEKKIKPKKKAMIAILDTGVDSGHEDLKGNYRSTIKRYDDDPQGHGTHCAGIAAAVSNNGKGIASFSLDNNFVQVTSIRVLSSFGIGTQKSIIEGMLKAADAGADVISMSLGGPSSDSKQRAYRKAVEYANKKGAIVICSAGNNGANAKTITPANVDGVIAVSAVDSNLNKATFSNHIADVKMGIAAPGVSIYSTFPNNEYRALSGTSMSAPYVSGLVGLLKSIQPDLKTKEVYDILKKSGADTKDTGQTGKLIQPADAVLKL